jgi:hypothetical protein
MYICPYRDTDIRGKSVGPLIPKETKHAHCRQSQETICFYASTSVIKPIAE